MKNLALTTISALIATTAFALVRYFIHESFSYLILAIFFVISWLAFYFSQKYLGKKCC